MSPSMVPAARTFGSKRILWLNGGNYVEWIYKTILLDFRLGFASNSRYMALPVLRISLLSLHRNGDTQRHLCPIVGLCFRFVLLIIWFHSYDNNDFIYSLCIQLTLSNLIIGIPANSQRWATLTHAPEKQRCKSTLPCRPILTSHPVSFYWDVIVIIFSTEIADSKASTSLSRSAISSAVTIPEIRYISYVPLTWLAGHRTASLWFRFWSLATVRLHRFVVSVTHSSVRHVPSAATPATRPSFRPLSPIVLHCNKPRYLSK